MHTANARRVLRHGSDRRLQGGVSLQVLLVGSTGCACECTVSSSVAGTWLVTDIVLATGQAASQWLQVLVQHSLLQGTYGIPFSNLAAAIYSFIKSFLQGITRRTFVNSGDKCLDGFVVLLYIWERVGLTKEVQFLCLLNDLLGMFIQKAEVWTLVETEV